MSVSVGVVKSRVTYHSYYWQLSEPLSGLFNRELVCVYYSTTSVIFAL